eukprot:6209608-Pleurochrysis_carterae.AAC.6
MHDEARRTYTSQEDHHTHHRAHDDQPLPQEPDNFCQCKLVRAIIAENRHTTPTQKALAVELSHKHEMWKCLSVSRSVSHTLSSSEAFKVILRGANDDMMRIRAMGSKSSSNEGTY